MLIIAITFILLFNSVFSTELDFILKDTGLAASKKSSIILKDSILPNNYQVGPGDEFFINVVSNNLSINEYLVISPLGDIVLPHIGVLNIDKVYISDAFDLIEDKYSNKFDNIDFHITLTDVRRFKVLVMGIRNGPYYINTNPLEKVSDIYRKAINNKLIINKSQVSKRNIVLDRSGEISNVDIIEINNIINSYNPLLIEGDIIILKNIYQTINIQGGINNPGKYEFKNNETLLNLIKISGGFSVNADSNNISISRFNDNVNEQKFLLKNFNKSKIFDLKPNDYITIPYKKNSKSRNFVYIGGEVVTPGHYVLDDNMTFKDLLIKSGGYTKNADTSKILVENNFFLDKIDLEFERISLIPPNKRTTSEISYLKSRNLINNGLIISDNEEFTKQILTYELNQNDSVQISPMISYVEIIGGVKNPGRYPFSSTFTVDDYIEDAGGKTSSSTKKIYIIDNTNQKIRVRKNNVKLNNGDILFVENKVDSNFWISLKESMGLIGQLATLIAVIQSAQNN